MNFLVFLESLKLIRLIIFFATYSLLPIKERINWRNQAINKSLIALLNITILGGLIAIGVLIINPTYAGSFFDNSKQESFFNRPKGPSFFDSDETKQIRREKAEREYYIMKERAEEDHEAGYENSDSDHSLEEHNDSNRYDY